MKLAARSSPGSTRAATVICLGVRMRLHHVSHGELTASPAAAHHEIGPLAPAGPRATMAAKPGAGEDGMNQALRTPPTTAMRRIPGGGFLMGSDRHYPEEAPAHRVRVAAFEMDETTVTNRQFAAFVAATGYVTVAERPLDPAVYPERRAARAPARRRSSST